MVPERINGHRIISARMRGLTLAAFLFLSPILVAQNYFFDNYSVTGGIAQSTIFDIHQDQNDYIWLGTRAGTSRFDGIEFINYTVENGMAQNGVRVIFRDKNNHLWFGHSGGGITVFDGRKFRIFSASGSLFKSDITAIIEDDSNNLWITSELSGVIRISQIADSLSGSEYKLYKGHDLSDRVYNAYKDRNGVLYFITDAFLKIYVPEEDQFKSFYVEGMPTYFLITCMYEDRKDNLWFGTHHGGLYKYNRQDNYFRVFDLRDGLSYNWISDITEDKHGDTWVGTWGGGISVITDDTIRIMDNSNGLTDLKIRKIIEDREGNMLIGTNENGISIFKGYQFISYFPENGLIDPQVWSILEDQNQRFWFGTSGGISIYDPKKPSNEKFIAFNRLKGNRISFLEEDIKSRIWIGTDNQGVFTYNQKNREFSYEHMLNSYISSLIVTALETDNEGRIWAGTLDGLVMYDYDSRTTRYFTQSNGLSGNEITSLYYAPDGKMWIGSRGYGLNYFVDDSIHLLDLKESFTPTCMVSDSKGRLWAGTEARGVLQIDPEEKSIIRDFKENDGLLANLINLIMTNGEDKVYIGTNKGLNVYDPEKSKLYSYGQKNGFIGIETKPGAVFHDREGRLWFGTIKGVTSLYPEQMQPSEMDPLTHITGFRVNLEDRDLTQGTKLKYNENDIVFQYISICLKNPEAVAYQIMLEGADNDWRPVTTQTEVTYPALSPKKYTFKVIGRNSDGNWNREPIVFQFEIRPPFYKTSWFIMLCIFIGITGIVAYVKIRERNLVREKRVLEEKVVERTAEVVAQKEQLAQKNKDITDSIRYAKRIQVAILPVEIPFEDTFVLFKPKDIVSGDFYWLEKVGNKEFLAAVDCTGHGVPGAFMSIIGTNLLNKIVKEQLVHEPAEILNILNVELINNLKTTDEENIVYDGMDLALVCYDNKTSELEYAGGYNPLLLIRNGELIEYKADRFSTGRSSSVDLPGKFTNHRVKIMPGDAIYIYSDGYADQFGGETGKKFKSKPMKELFIAIHEKSVEHQRSILNSTFEAWKGDMDQVDDILIIGRKF